MRPAVRWQVTRGGGDTGWPWAEAGEQVIRHADDGKHRRGQHTTGHSRGETLGTVAVKGPTGAPACSARFVPAAPRAMRTEAAGRPKGEGLPRGPGTLFGMLRNGTRRAGELAGEQAVDQAADAEGTAPRWPGVGCDLARSPRRPNRIGRPAVLWVTVPPRGAFAGEPPPEKLPAWEPSGAERPAGEAARRAARIRRSPSGSRWSGRPRRPRRFSARPRVSCGAPGPLAATQDGGSCL